MIALLDQIPTEAKIQKELRTLRFGKHVCCVWCQTRNVYAVEGRYRCRKCRKSFALLSRTWLSGAKLSLRTIWALCWCWTQKVPIQQTQKLCQVSEPTVRYWFHQFRQHLPVFEPILTGTIQMDEAYFRDHALLLAKEIGTRRLAYFILHKTTVDKHEASQFLFQYVAPNSRLYTDGSGIYRAIERFWPVTHRQDIHKKFEFELTSEIEGAFGNLRTFIRRMYHHTTPEYFPFIVGEFCHRFSHPETFHSPLTFLKETL